MKSLLLSLSLFLFAGLAPAQSITNLDDMTAEEAAVFGAAVRNYLLSNPEVIIEAITVFKQREQQESVANDVRLVQEFAEDLFYDGFSYVAGNPDGSILMVEFLDYRCAVCKRAHPEVQALLDANPDIRLVVKEYPILGAESTLASRAAVSVLVNDGAEVYGRFSDALMRFDGPINEETLTQLATESGADAAQMMEMLNAALVTQIVQSTRLLGQRMAINGTPTFVLGGDMLRGYLPQPQMQILVDQLRASLN